jgi:5'-nucleotidase
MPVDLSKYLVIAISSRALFDLEEEERIYQRLGLEKYREFQLEKENELLKLVALQRQFPISDAPLRMAIVTARNSPAHERVIKTLRSWGVGVDAAFFLGGVAKQPVLKAFGAHIFFDDQEDHLALASMSVPSALVPYSTRSVLRKPRTVERIENSRAGEKADAAGGEIRSLAPDSLLAEG